MENTHNNYLTLPILLFLSILYFENVSGCSILPGFKFATIEEQVDYANSIFVGRVRKVITIIPSNTWAILLDRYQILKGGQMLRWGRRPRVLEITGFAGGSLCGPAPPKKGERVAVFVCPNKDSNTWQTQKKRNQWRGRYWKLNKFVIGAGVANLKYKSNSLRKIRRLSRKYRFDDFSNECRGRPRKGEVVEEPESTGDWDFFEEDDES